MNKFSKVIAAVSAALALLSGDINVYAAPVKMDDGVLFDADYYASTYPDVVEVLGTDDAAVLYQHYKTFGRAEGRFSTAEKEKAATGRITVRGKVKRWLATDRQIEEYFKRSVFVGDSIMTGYKMYVNSYESLASGSFFLATESYATYHALKEKDNLHPLYRGLKQPVWKSIASMDVDRVFIMFGTNDLICFDVDRTSRGIYELAEKIREEVPGIEVVLISMTPVYGGAGKNHLNNKNVDQLNATLKEAAKDNGWSYLDINTLLKAGGSSLPAKYCSDKLVHETYDAYRIWDRRLTRYATDMLQSAGFRFTRTNDERP